MNLVLFGKQRFAVLCGFLSAIIVTGIGIIDATAEIIPTDRRVDWSYATVGVPGGITNRTKIYTTIPSGASAATINSAIASCPAGQVVKLSAGNYSGLITFGTKSGVTLRGEGKNTILTGRIIMGSGVWNGNASGTQRYWNNGTTITSANKGDTNITVASTGDLAVGWLAFIDEVNDKSLVFGQSSDPRAKGQAVMIKKIAGNVVTVWPPLVTDFSSSRNAQMRSQSGIQIAFSSVEDIQMEGDGSQTGFILENGYGCWLKNVGMHNMQNYNLTMLCCVNCTITKCDFRDSPDHSNNHYGIGIEASCTGNLIEDNIAWRIGPNIEINYASVGNVIAYNYFYNSLYATSGSMDLDDNHAPHNMMNLFEGNFVGVQQADGYFGSSSHHTFLRNRITGRNPESDGKPFAISLNRYVYYYNYVGNVLGDTARAVLYEGTANNESRPMVWALGYPNIGNMGFSAVAPPSVLANPPSGPSDNQYYDSRVGSTILRHGNFDVTTGTNSGVRWDPNIADHNIPTSYYLTAKPAWFGTCPWPPYDPLATTAARLSPTNIPAGYRFTFGTDVPTGATNAVPTVIANATPKIGVSPLTVTFSSTGSFDPEGTALSYNWVFGDGKTSTAANPTNTYQASGSYVARLTVSDGANAVSSANINISVQVAPPSDLRQVGQ